MLRSFLIATIASVIFVSCGNLNTLKIQDTNFGDEVQQAQNLVFTFNKKVVADTSVFNKWDTTAYLVFSPAIRGRFMWTASDQLTFSPEHELPAATAYEALFTKELLKYSPKHFNLSRQPIRFATPVAKLEAATGYWAMQGEVTRELALNVQLRFNHAIDPRVLKPLLTIKVAGKELPFDMVSQNGDATLIVACNPSIQDAGTGQGELLVQNGLASMGGNLKTTHPLSIEFALPPKDKLEITGLETGFDQGKGFIQVFTSQPVDPEVAHANLKIEPALDVETAALPNGFMIKGDFMASKTYTLSIAKTFTNVFGRPMMADYRAVASFAEPSPSVHFTSPTAMYLSSRGARNLGVSIVNIPKVKVSVFKIFENNIQQYLRMGRSWDFAYEDNNYYDISTWAFDPDYGRPVFSREIPVKSLQKQGNIYLLNLNPSDMNLSETYKGLYLVRVEASDRRYLQDAQMLSLSDLGLIVKQGVNDINVFVNSLTSASPLSGVKVDFVSSNNQKVYSATTGSDGVAVFKNYGQGASGFTISMVSARLGDDFNFVAFDKTRVETSRYDVGGKYINSAGYDVMVYSDRNLYRPGDSIHGNVIVRSAHWEVMKDIPMKIRLLAPNGKVMLSSRRTLSGNGSMSWDALLPVQALTGVYSLEVSSANDVLMQSYKMAVEEFVPDRISVKANTNKTVYLPAENIDLSLQVDNLYGTPAAGRRFETELRLQRKGLIVPALPDFSFDIESHDAPVLASIMGKGTTDAQGKATVVLRSDAYKNIGLLQGTIFTTVFDETGRPVNRLNPIDIPTQQVYLGIRRLDEWVSTRTPLNFQFAAVDRNGRLLPSAQAKVVIIRYNYENVIENNGSRYDYISQRKEKIVMSREINISGRDALLPFTPIQSGEYELRLMLPGSDTYISQKFYAYGLGDTDYTSFEVDREGQVDITADKSEYNVGDKARLLFKTPFDGNLLVTIEQQNVLSYKYLKVTNKSTSLELPITSSHLPNVYISTTLFRSVSTTGMPLTVAHGIVSVKVKDESTRLKVVINSASQSRSGVRQPVVIQTAPEAEVTLAIVDEGILQITGFKTPDPWGFFYDKRALGVDSYDLYGLLLPEYKRSSVAGGEAFDLSKRVNPLTGERVKLLSKWSGVRKADASGNVTFPLDLPQFSGALRLMAVASKGNRFGSAEKRMQVADAVVVSMSAPRFLSPGDMCKLTINAANTTSAAMSANCTLSLSGPVSLIGTKIQSLKLGAHADGTVPFELQAGTGIGNAVLKAEIVAGGQKFVQEITVPVRPAAGLQYSYGSGTLAGGKEISLKPTGNWMPCSTNGFIVAGPSPALQIGRSLSYLIRYPYGCLEQTVSCAFPQLYLADLFKLMENQGTAATATIHTNIQDAINRAAAQQLYNGGMSLWPEGGTADWWATAYATHFLIEAKTNNYDVSPQVLSGATKYLVQKVKERETGTYFYWSNNQRLSRVVPRPEILYSLYVLALADQPQLASMNYYKSLAPSLSIEGRYLLAATYALAGDTRTYQQLLPSGYGDDKPEATTGGNYASYLRDQSLVANALLETDAAGPQLPLLIRSISDELNRSKYLNTQEASFALLVLGKQAKRAAAFKATTSLRLNGKEVAHGDQNGLKFSGDLLNKNLSLLATGKGLQYYYYELSGIPLAPTANEDSFLKVRKRYLDRNGKEVSGRTFMQDDLVYVELTVESDGGKSIDNVVVTDLLPACFEVENSRLVAERSPGFMQDRSTADYTDIRDDRVNFFTSLGAGKKTFYYTVRAVNKGVYQAGAATADAMYNGQYHSVWGAGKISVK